MPCTPAGISATIAASVRISVVVTRFVNIVFASEKMSSIACWIRFAAWRISSSEPEGVRGDQFLGATGAYLQPLQANEPAPMLMGVRTLYCNAFVTRTRSFHLPYVQLLPYTESMA